MAITVVRPSATRRSSDLSKHSAEVFAEAEDHPVTVTRRDGEALVLMSQREADARAELLDLADTLLAAALEGGILAERIASRFPWMYALKAEDRDDCAREVIDAARASFATQQPHLAIATLTSWRETATASAAGLGSQPVEWIDEDDKTAVERPRRPSKSFRRPTTGSLHVLKKHDSSEAK
ncbi:type II toxin-antitoxin system Phd/YefM family antitoxin [Arthrobacter sp. MMS24-S77]